MPSMILPALAALALPAPQADDAADLRVAALRDAALEDDYAYAITEAITTELGPRLAGTPEEARARKWAVSTLTKMGFKNVRDEPFPLRTWVRGTEKAMVIGENSQPLVLTALGNSGATPTAGLTGEVVFFPTLDDLKDAPDGSLTGKIAFVSHAMTRTQDGSQYGYYGAVRRQGPAIAAAKGAAAILIRSVGTDSHRMPHAGSTVFPEGTAPIPAAALAVPDADQLERLAGRGAPVQVALTLTPRIVGTQNSGNVIAEVPGRDPAAGIVVVACHLDSWDLGTGAIDDASGCGIVAAAAKRIMDAGRPRRTIRVLWAGSEEVGVFGGKAYFEAHKGDNHVLAAESDFGADRIWRLDTNFAPANKPLADRLAAALAPLGISAGRDPASGGADVAALVSAGVAGVDLQQDGSRYFDLHHTPDDTLDKVDPAQMRQNVAGWTAMLAVVADAPEPISATK